MENAAALIPGPPARLAIVIPSYKNASTIAQTLQSLQRLPDLAQRVSGVYIFDDASPDATVQVARDAWESTVPLHIEVAPRNRSLYGNANHSLRSVAKHADWALLLHGDDLVRPEWLREFAAAIDAAPARCITVGCSWNSFDGQHSANDGENRTDAWEIVEPSELAVANTLIRGCWWHISGSAIHLENFIQSGAFQEDLTYFGDYEWLMRILERGYSVIYIPRALIDFRQHEASASSASFHTHLDVREVIRVLPRYASYLNAWQVLCVHGFWMGLLLRRLVKGSVSRHWGRVSAALRLLPKVFACGLRCLRMNKPAGQAWT